ncbi:hypothetical protein Tco_0798620 [Tanacetum coccineum]
MICNMDSIGKYMREIILHQQRTPQLLKQKKLMQTQEDHSNPIQSLNVDSLKVDLVVVQNTCSEKEDSNSETTSSKSEKESSLDYATKDVHAIKYKISKAKERCMAYFHSLHSHLHVLSKEDLKGTHIEHGFKRAFMSLYGQDDDTFTSTMFLNVDQLQKQLDKDDFQEDGSMAAFWVVNRKFQKLIDSQFSLDYDSQMTEKYFAEYTRIEYDRKVNKRQMETQESKIDTSKAVDADLVFTESSGTESEVQDDSSRSGNDTDADDADIRPIYDEETMAEVQLTAECNIFAIGQQHTEQPEIINEVNEHLNKENETLKKHYKDLYDSIKITRSKTMKQTTSLLTNNADLKAQIQEKIFTGHIFSSNKSSAVYEKTSTRSCLRWKPTGRIFNIVGGTDIQQRGQKTKQKGQNQAREWKKCKKSKPKAYTSLMGQPVPILLGQVIPLTRTSVGLRWIATGKLLDSCPGKVDSEPPHGSNVDISKIHECKQTLDLRVGKSINVQKKQSIDLSAGTSYNVKKENLRVWLLKRMVSQKPGLQGIHN